MKQKIELLIQILLGGLAFHFFAHTVAVYGRGLGTERIWAWKEIIVVVLSLFLLISLVKKRGQFVDVYWKIGVIVVMLLLGWSLVVSYGLHGQSLMDRVVAIRYDFFPFVTLLVVWGLFSFQGTYRERLYSWFCRILQLLVVLSLLWYLIVSLAPQWIEWLGYSMEAWQRGLGSAPPVRYLTNVWWGYVRNQGLFGGPVSWGLYLVAFRPFFMMRQVTRTSSSLGEIREPEKNASPLQWGDYVWLIIYTSAVILTFSRVVRLVFVLESFALVILLYGKGLFGDVVGFVKKSWRMCLTLCLGVVMSVVLIGLLGPADVPVAEDRDQGLRERELSDKGHVELLLEGVEYLKVYPVSGRGAGAAGPASYRVDTEEERETFFNTENQYLQIGVEWGLVGLVVYLIFLVYLLWLCFYGYKKTHSEARGGTSVLVGIGLLGLMAAGMLQHSLVDVQVMVSLMVVMGMSFGRE